MESSPNTGDAQTVGSGSVLTPCRDIFERLRPHELISRSRSGVERLDQRVLELTDVQLDTWFEESDGVGLWSCRALLTHLMDVEVLATMRYRRVIAEDHPVFENWDEEAFVGSRLSRPGDDAALLPAGACLAVIYTLRQTNAVMLVQLNEEDWDRRAMNPYMGDSTLLDMLVYQAWHLEHHAAYLRAKLDAMLGPAPEPDPNAQAGCGAGCSCVPAEQSDEPSGEVG